MKTEDRTVVHLLTLLLVFLFIVALFTSIGPRAALGPIWVLVFYLCFGFILWALLRQSVPATREPQRMVIRPDRYPRAVREVMDVHLGTREGEVLHFRGRLLQSAETAVRQMEQDLDPEAVPLIQEDEEFGASIFLLPKPTDERALERPVRTWLNWLLFGLTLLTTTWAGAAHQGVNLLQEPGRFAMGLPYSLGLLAILGVHELGHYFTARLHGIHVTPPYFIPVPLALGTFGAFIQMRSPTHSRRALFDVAVAGPLAGLVIAIPALLLGLSWSEVVLPMKEDTSLVPLFHEHGTSVHSSILLALLAKAALPDALAHGCTVLLHPLAFAGWLGLLVTALNLMPIGQLDGGHMARAMFGSRIGAMIGSVAMWSLFLLALFVWPGLMMWALIVFLLAGRGTPPLNDVTPVSPARQSLGYFTFAILALILLPLPEAFLVDLGIDCPYL